MRAVFLDRDGVINQDMGSYVTTPADWHAIPGSLEAIALLSRQGWPVFVVTNQAGIERGIFSLSDLDAVHAKMLQEVTQAGGKIQEIHFCPSFSPDHPLRKPNPGMLLELALRHALQLEQSVFVGDHLRDIEAARRAGCQPALVQTGHGAEMLQQHAQELADVPIFSDLFAFTQHWLQQYAKSDGGLSAK